MKKLIKSDEINGPGFSGDISQIFINDLVSYQKASFGIAFSFIFIFVTF